MIRNINDGDTGVGRANLTNGESDPDPSREVTPEAEEKRFDDENPVGDDPVDESLGEEPLGDEPVDDVTDDVIERKTVGLEAVGLDTVEGARPRSVPASSDLDSLAQEPAVKPRDAAELKGAVEAILFSVSEPIGIRALGDLVGTGVHEVRSAVEELRYEYADAQRAFRLEEIAGGVQLLTQSRFDPWIGRLRQKEKERRLSAAALETLSVVAYKQPITKADLEGIRGVGCSQILKTLLDRGLLEVVGRDEGLGKPLLYGTTKRFLESFGLESVRDLPQPEDVEMQDDEGAPAEPA